MKLEEKENWVIILRLLCPALRVVHQPHEGERNRELRSLCELRSHRPHQAGIKKSTQSGFFYLIAWVAEPGVAPGLEDYEPSVRLYTTPRVEGLYGNCTWRVNVRGVPLEYEYHG